MGFVELQDFTTKMILIAPNDKTKISKYRQEIGKAAFLSIKSDNKFKPVKTNDLQHYF